MKRALHRALQRAGWDLMRYPPLPAPNRETARHLSIALEHFPVDGVVDVGAHRGGFVNVLRDDIGYRGPVVSFEPSPANYRALTRSRSSDLAWSGHNLALGSASSTMSLHVFRSADNDVSESDSTSFNSLHAPNAYGREAFAAFLGSHEEEQVQVRRLDEVLDLPGRLLLKSDTQGHDLEVIAGAGDILSRVDILFVELSVRPIYEGMPSMLQMLGTIHELGFQPAGMSEVSREGAHVIEYDGVFVR